MYAYIIGTIQEKSEQFIVLENNGIGYEVFASSNTISTIGNVGTTAKIYTYFHVREDAQLLFGFANLNEKNMFLNLINVSGIGSKMAISILSSISVSDLLSAIAMGDLKLLQTLKGVGKKTAERLLLELKGKIGSVASETVNMFNSQETKYDPRLEAVDVLVSMGINRISATDLVKMVYEPDDTTEKLIEKCLKQM